MNIRQTAIPRRVLSLALCAAMVLTLLPLPTPAEGICDHHSEHTADCGYKAAVEGQDCAHSHNSLCGYQEASPCSHSHDESCGYREASACAHRHTEECGENGESCTHQHDEACGYQEASPCTHSHDESCGYREARACTHAHDDTCGYVEAVTGSPCTYRCEICAQQASQQQNGQDLCTHGNESAACETCASEKKVTEVQALINALPETVTEETREAAQSALSAVEEAKAALTEAEQEKLDLTRYTALKALLAEPEAVDTGKVLTDWEWVDPDEWLDETGSFAMPGVTEDYPAYFEDVVEYLPTQITALIDGVEVTLDLGVWECDDYPVETGTSQGKFVFTATLPEGYVLADGSNTLPLPVTVAPMNLSDGEDVSGYNSGGNGQNEQWDDVKSNGVRNWNKDTSKFEFGKGEAMYYRAITQKYDYPTVEWTKYEYLWQTNVNPTGVTVFPGYCVHSQTAEITGTLTIKDDINLILCAEQTNADELPDMVLTVGSINIDSGKTLTIWTKNGGWQGGKLIVKGNISGGGTLVVRDGYVEAQNITCKFSTGGSENGKQSLGVVKANSISDKSDEANWGGVIVENGVGRACGTAAQELIYDLQCEELTIDSGKTLTVGWDGYTKSNVDTIGARHNVKLIADNLVNNGTLINKAKLYYNTLSGSGKTDPSNGRYGYYKNENGQNVYRPFTLVTSDITELTNTADTNDGWYLVSGNVEWANRVAVAANTTVNLVLADGCTLTAKEGITVGGAGTPTLIIWCQEAGTGTLHAQTSNEQCAAIGMNGDGTSTGVITIHGGNINAEYTGADSIIHSKNCGLGGYQPSAACTVTINGGTINTPALVSNNLTINGGTITVLNRISGQFLAPATDGGSTFVTADSNWAGGRSNRRGLFFFGATGEVCTGSGTALTLARAMEVPAGKTLVIPKGKTLNAGSYLTNSGAVCVGGAYTGSLSGDIYYRLSVEGGTAASAGNIKAIDDVTYVKAGSTVTLTSGAAPDGKRFDYWNPPAGLPLNNDNTFTMPANTVDISAEYSDAVVITQQPIVQEITYGESATLSVTAQNPSNTTDGITYQWYQVINNNEKELPGETNASLKLTALNAGTYSYFCRVTWEGISIDSSRATVTVKKVQASVTITGNPGKTYDGQPATLTTDGYSVTGDGTVTVEYKKQGEANYSTTAPINAGSYTVRVTLAAGTNYTGDYATKNFTISKAYNTWTKEPSVKNPAYYGDTDLVTYQAKYGNENVNVRYLGENDQPVNSVNAGDYDVIVSLSEVDNYTGLSMVKMPLTILPRPIDETDISVEPGTFEYGGTTKTPTVTIQYKGKTLVEGKDYELTGATSGTDVDTYTLTVTGKGNYSGSKDQDWEIAKASITPVVSLGDTVYGDPLSPSVSGNPGNGEVTYTYYSDAACTDAVTPRNAGTYYVKAAVAETANYQSGESAPVSFRITQKPVTVSGITAGDKTYDGNTTATLNYAGVTFTGKLKGDSLTVEGTGTFADANVAENKTVTISGLTLGGDSKDNYVLAADGQQTTATAAITKANASVTKAPEDAKSLYSGLDVPLVTEGTAQGGTMMYRLGEDGSWTELLPRAAAHGEYTVYYYVKGDGNHEDTAQQSLKARIRPFEITGQTEAGSIKYGESTELSVTLNDKATDVSGITYQWCLVTGEDGKEIYTPLEGETGKELTLTKPNAGKYVYACIITCGDYSVTSDKATVTVTAVQKDLTSTSDLPSDLWAEGGEEPLNGDSVELKSPSSFLLTSYTYNGASTDVHQNYPTGMEIYSVGTDDQGHTTVAPVAELNHLLRYSGCSIRITGKPGIRMITSLTKEAKAALKKGELAGYTLEEYGTVVAWTTELGDQPLTLSTGKSSYAYKKGVSDPVFANVGNLTQYTNVLVWDSLDDQKYDEDIVMRPYIKLSNKAGETVVLYGGTVSRSIGYVAQQNANTFSKGTAGYKYVHEIIDKVNALHSSTETNTTGG